MNPLFPGRHSPSNVRAKPRLICYSVVYSQIFIERSSLQQQRFITLVFRWYTAFQVEGISKTIEFYFPTAWVMFFFLFKYDSFSSHRSFKLMRWDTLTLALSHLFLSSFDVLLVFFHTVGPHKSALASGEIHLIKQKRLVKQKLYETFQCSIMFGITNSQLV